MGRCNFEDAGPAALRQIQASSRRPLVTGETNIRGHDPMLVRCRAGRELRSST
jgi:hypothetical protein